MFLISKININSDLSNKTTWIKYSSTVGQETIALPNSFSKIKIVALWMNGDETIVFSQSISFDRTDYTIGRIPICSGSKSWMYLAAQFRLYSTGNNVTVEIYVGDTLVTTQATVDVWYID